MSLLKNNNLWKLITVKIIKVLKYTKYKYVNTLGQFFVRGWKQFLQFFCAMQ